VDGDIGEEVIVEVGIEAHDNVNGVAKEQVSIQGEIHLADNMDGEAYEDPVVECEAEHVVGDGEEEVGGEDPIVECEIEVEHIVGDGEEELGGETDIEEDDEYEVSSWTDLKVMTCVRMNYMMSGLKEMIWRTNYVMLELKAIKCLG